ncbi:MAG: hypothetical protein ACI3VA_10080 [Candidatus Limivicinus sp.]
MNNLKDERVGDGMIVGEYDPPLPEIKKTRTKEDEKRLKELLEKYPGLKDEKAN